MYTIEHLIFTFSAGIIIGSVSTMLLTRKELTVESTVALLIMALWLGMHSYGFLFNITVDWIFNIVGFGAAGTFVGINIRSGVGVKNAIELMQSYRTKK